VICIIYLLKNKKGPQQAARIPVQFMPLSYAGIIRIRFKGSPWLAQGSQWVTPLGLMFFIGAGPNYQQVLSQVNIFQGFGLAFRVTFDYDSEPWASAANNDEEHKSR